MAFHAEVSKPWLRMVLRRLRILFPIVLFFSCGEQEVAVSHHQPIATDTSENQIDAEKLYVRYCVDCHGVGGDLGLMGAKDLTTSTMSLDDRIKLITDGSADGKMKPFSEARHGDLNNQQIQAVAEFVETLRK